MNAVILGHVSLVITPVISVHSLVLHVFDDHGLTDVFDSIHSPG